MGDGGGERIMSSAEEGRKKKGVTRGTSLICSRLQILREVHPEAWVPADVAGDEAAEKGVILSPLLDTKVLRDVEPVEELAAARTPQGSIRPPVDLQLTRPSPPKDVLPFILVEDKEGDVNPAAILKPRLLGGQAAPHEPWNLVPHVSHVGLARALDGFGAVQVAAPPL